MPNVETVPVRDDDVPGLPVTVLQYPAELGGRATGVRPARLDDLERCAALINRTHRGLDLFRPHISTYDDPKDEQRLIPLADPRPTNRREPYLA